MGGLNMRSFALMEGDRSTMLHVRHVGDVTVFCRGRESPIRFRIAMHVDGDTTWRLLSRVMNGLVRAEDRLIRIDRLVERLHTGWRPVAGGIDPEIPQRMLRRGRFAAAARAVPGDPDDSGFFAPPRKMVRVGGRSHVRPAGKLVWSDAPHG